MKRIQFLIAGVQKAGTTSLDAYLRQHPKIAMAKKKELHFFDKRPPTGLPHVDYWLYHRHFDWGKSIPGTRFGEATPIYTWWPGALARIKAYNPAIKLIISLRHPVARAWSHYRMDARLGRHSESFSQLIRAEVDTVSAPPDRVRSCVSRGFYAPQIEAVQTLFPARQLCFLRSQDLRDEPAETLARICAFLEVGPIDFQAEPPHNQASDMGEIPEEDAAYLRDIFAEDIGRTRALLGWSTDQWPL